MSTFKYNSSQLFCENVNLEEVANDYGTPSYVYSKKAIEENTNTICNFFSLPYGSKNDYNDNVIKNLISSNYKKCFLNHGLFNLVDKNNFCINRISLTNNYNYDTIVKLF